MKNLKQTPTFQIVKHTTFDFYTKYVIKYKGSNYICNSNGSLPTLNGIRLNERLRSELMDLLENYFLDVICANHGVKKITINKF
jgi:hypothetical protein